MLAVGDKTAAGHVSSAHDPRASRRPCRVAPVVDIVETTYYGGAKTTAAPRPSLQLAFVSPLPLSHQWDDVRALDLHSELGAAAPPAPPSTRPPSDAPPPADRPPTCPPLSTAVPTGIRCHPRAPPPSSDMGWPSPARVDTGGAPLTAYTGRLPLLLPRGTVRQLPLPIFSLYCPLGGRGSCRFPLAATGGTCHGRRRWHGARAGAERGKRVRHEGAEVWGVPLHLPTLEQYPPAAVHRRGTFAMPRTATVASPPIRAFSCRRPPLTPRSTRLRHTPFFLSLLCLDWPPFPPR